jgi:hypothetical protein
VTNAPSNGICRSLGFALLGVSDVKFEGRPMHVHHWRLGADDEVITSSSE